MNIILLGPVWKWLDVCVLTLDYLIDHVDQRREVAVVVWEIWEIYGLNGSPYVYIPPIYCSDLPEYGQIMPNAYLRRTPNAFAIDAGLLGATIQSFQTWMQEEEDEEEKKVRA